MTQPRSSEGHDERGPGSTPWSREDELFRELIEQIFLSWRKALPSYRGDIPLEKFLGRVAANRAISFAERSSTALEKIESVQRDSEANVADPAHRTLLYEAARQLSLPERQVVVLVLEGFTYPEIREMLDIDAKALRRRVWRAKAAFEVKLLEREIGASAKRSASAAHDDGRFTLSWEYLRTESLTALRTFFSPLSGILEALGRRATSGETRVK